MARIDIKSSSTGGGGGSGTVTSVSIATGTTGTNVNATGTVTTSGTLTVNIPVASATNTGKLSSTDWSTFNSKGNGTVTSVGVTSTTLTVTGSPVTGSGSITAEIPDGYLKLASGASTTLQNVTDTDGTATQFNLGTNKQAFNGSLSVGSTTTPANTRLFIVGEDQLNTSGALRIQDSTNADLAVITNDGSMVIGGAGVPLAKLQVNSTTSGFLPPRMTNTERAAISALKGNIVVNTTNNAIAYNDGTAWGYLSGALQTVAGSGGTVNIPFASGNIVNMTLTASTILTFSTHVVGTYIIKLIQGGSGSYTITWPGTVVWSGGTAPTLTTTVGKTDIITLFHDGTNFYGTYSLNY